MQADGWLVRNDRSVSRAPRALRPRKLWLLPGGRIECSRLASTAPPAGTHAPPHVDNLFCPPPPPPRRLVVQPLSHSPPSEFLLLLSAMRRWISTFWSEFAQKMQTLLNDIRRCIRRK